MPSVDKLPFAYATVIAAKAAAGSCQNFQDAGDLGSSDRLDLGPVCFDRRLDTLSNLLHCARVRAGSREKSPVHSTDAKFRGSWRRVPHAGWAFPSHPTKATGPAPPVLALGQPARQLKLLCAALLRCHRIDFSIPEYLGGGDMG